MADCASALAAALVLVAAARAELGPVRSQLHSQLQSPLRSQLQSQLRCSPLPSTQLRSQLHSQLHSQVRSLDYFERTLSALRGEDFECPPRTGMHKANIK